ncbi:hypothetical protein Acr_11g0011660 [Actinidia rufa]|uniref:Chaperone DnaJ-domain superfamily protein n=1 Tax=Actinidia rufa TaxID=165716 RepID=A0A7J0FDT1_9ERIC|nr:hypothetical protein Acr_11g0011660 [Actinidia rufa]
MASTASPPPASYSLPTSARNCGREEQKYLRRRGDRGGHSLELIQEFIGRMKRRAGLIGGRSNSQSAQEEQFQAQEDQKNRFLDEKFSDCLTVLKSISRSRHGRDESIIQTTSLPLKAASNKFMQLREIYDVLSNEERRRFYNWMLAQEAANHKAKRMRVKLNDPHMQEVENWESVLDMVDRYSGALMHCSVGCEQKWALDIDMDSSMGMPGYTWDMCTNRQ